MARVKLLLWRFTKLKNIASVLLVLLLLLLLKKLGVFHASLDMIPINYPYEGNWDQNVKYFVPRDMQKIDWHDYERILTDKKRTGIGEQGAAAKLPDSKKELEEQLYSVNGFNGALSDEIALNRSLPDIRHPKCKERLYIASLPTVSVVVPFHNEHWSTLLRTAVSVLYRSPKHLIKEILLVDDASTKVFLKEKLDDYLRVNYPKVRVVRLPVRSGLITARLAGAKEAVGDVLIFLDSHTEANVNWLPPLLEPIALDHRTVVCPFIDVVAYDTFEYRAQDEGARGAFDWEFFYKRLRLRPADLAHMPEPFESPVMAGGLFAISRQFFWLLGGYDPGLDIWGGEQYELSFKIWQCGGRMVDAPCSRVGHIYRKFAPFPNPRVGSDFVGKNYRRVAEVWMDEYAEYLYKRRPHYRSIPTGDITEQLALKKQLACKPFKWFMTHVAFDLTFHYPLVDPQPYASGKISPEEEADRCVDARGGADRDRLQLSLCNSDHQKTELEFVFSWHKDIKSKARNMCWDLPDSKPHSPVLLYSCHLGGGNQFWKYDQKTKQLVQGINGNVCLQYDHIKKKSVFVNYCDPAEKRQRWVVEKINEEQMSHWGDKRRRPIGPPPPGETEPITEAGDGSR